MFKSKFLFITIAIFILHACKNDTSIVFSESNITTKNNTIVDVNIPFAEGNMDAAKKINTDINHVVAQALQIEASDLLTPITAEESISKFNEDHQAFLTDFPYSAQPWEAQIDGDVMYLSPEIISIAITSYINTGGAHGLLTIKLLNFDGLTGEQLSNSDLFLDTEAFKIGAQPYFKDAIKDEDEHFNPDSFKLPENIGYTPDGILLIYNPYEISPYSAGIIEITIPNETVESLLNFNNSQ
jgi:hypothetical protein